MEEFAKLAGSIVGSFIAAFIITWLISRPVRWIVVKAAPHKREIAAFCALVSMVFVAFIAWKKLSDTQGIIFDVALCLSIGINFLLDWAWAKYPQPAKGAVPNEKPTPQSTEAAEQIVGPERRQRVSHQTWCGEG